MKKILNQECDFLFEMSISSRLSFYKLKILNTNTLPTSLDTRISVWGSKRDLHTCVSFVAAKKLKNTALAS